MTVEQRAEAAAEEIDRSMTDGPVTIIAKHMQAAIDKATAPLRQRIAELEGLGPLIEDAIRYAVRFGVCADESETEAESAKQLDSIELEISLILKGGAE